jgi:3-oxoacyl-[acyl-carrier-protein] synthase II
MARTESVAVVGVGLVTPAGSAVDVLWQALVAAHATAAPWADDRLPAHSDVLACIVSDFDPTSFLTPVEIRRLDRCHQFAIGAAQEAIDAVAGGPMPAAERGAIVCGVGFGATATYETQHERLLDQGLRALSPLAIPMVMPNSVTAHLSMRFGFRGPAHTVCAACASGTLAIGEGVDLLRRGSADLVLAGGADAMVTYNAICSYLRLDAMSRNVRDPAHASRPFDVGRDGFVLAEGAGFVVLERLADARANGRRIYGLVLGFGSNSDAYHLVAPSPNGEGAQRCMELALLDAGIGIADVAHVNAHGTSTPLNDSAEASALCRLFRGTTPPVSAVKGTTGHMIGGSGAVEAIVALWSLHHGLAPPIAGLEQLDPACPIDVVIGEPRALADGAVLSTSFGFGGANACLVLKGGFGGA